MDKSDLSEEVQGSTSVQRLELAEEAAEACEATSGEAVGDVTETPEGKSQGDSVVTEQDTEEGVSQQDTEGVSQQDSEEGVSQQDTESVSQQDTEEGVSQQDTVSDLDEESSSAELLEDRSQSLDRTAESTKEVADSSESESSDLKDTGSEVTEETESGLESSVVSSLQEEEDQQSKSVSEEVGSELTEDTGSILESSQVSSLQEEESEAAGEDLDEDETDKSSPEVSEKKQESECLTEEKKEEETSEKKQESEVISEDKEEVVNSHHDGEEESHDLVDCRPETKDPVLDIGREPLTKETEHTKENTKDEGESTPKEGKSPAPELLSIRRGSGEDFQKIKNKFSNGFGVEENNKKNKENFDKSRKPAAAMSDSKSKRFGGTSEKCTQCNRTVYPMEKMEVAGRLLHKTCFKCCKCNSQLSVGRFSIGGKDMYCMTHYKQAFREKGTYDVFTPDNPIKGKWENKA